MGKKGTAPLNSAYSNQSRFLGLAQSGTSGLKQKNRTFALVRSYIKLLRTGADRRKGILMSLLLFLKTIIKKGNMFYQM